MSLSSWFATTIHREVSKCLCSRGLQPLFMEKGVNGFVLMVATTIHREVSKCLCSRGLQPLFTEK